MLFLNILFFLSFSILGFAELRRYDVDEKCLLQNEKSYSLSFELSPWAYLSASYSDFEILSHQEVLWSTKDQIKKTKVVSTKVKILDEILGPNNYEINEIEQSEFYYPKFTKTVEIHLGSMNSMQFTQLKAIFGMGKSKVHFSEKANYQLQDFLPSALGALFYISPQTNCFGFVSSFVDSTSNSVRDIRGQSALVQRLNDRNFFRPLEVGESIAPGDILVSAYRPQEAKDLPSETFFNIDHVLIYLDENLTVGANPPLFQLGSFMGGRFLQNESGELIPFERFVKGGKFLGTTLNHFLNTYSNNRSNLELIGFRQINQIEKPFLFNDFTGQTEATYPFLKIPLLFDDLGRAFLNGPQAINCLKKSNITVNKSINPND